jgi:hypothetical protein
MTDYVDMRVEGDKVFIRMEIQNAMMAKPVMEWINVTDHGAYGGVRWSVKAGKVTFHVPKTLLQRVSTTTSSGTSKSKAEKKLPAVEPETPKDHAGTTVLLFAPDHIIGELTLPNPVLQKSTLAITEHTARFYLVHGRMVRVIARNKEHNKGFTKVIAIRQVRELDGRFYLDTNDLSKKTLGSDFQHVVQFSKYVKKPDYSGKRVSINKALGVAEAKFFTYQPEFTTTNELTEALRKARQENIDAMRDR